MELALVRAALAIVPELPRRAVLGIARTLGGWAFHLSGSLRRVGTANLALAFPQQSDRERRILLRQSFNTFALMILDTFWFAKDTRARIQRWIRIPEAAREAFLKPGAQIGVTAHMGNWEILGMAIALEGLPIASVAAPIANERLDRIFIGIRESTGQRILDKHGAVRGMLKALRDGGKIALLLDQNTVPRDGGVFVDFFGRPVPVSSAVAVLALKTGAPVTIGGCVPAADGGYDIAGPFNVPPPDAPKDPSAAVQEFTQRILQGIEAMVSAHPGAWLWMYKRWKYIPPGAEAARYPDYAKPMRPRHFPAGKSSA